MPAPISAPQSLPPIGNPGLSKILSRTLLGDGSSIVTLRAMPVEIGCVIQTTTHQRNPDGSYSVAEALAFVPGVRCESDVNGGHKIVAVR